MDELDNKIISMLRHNGRASNSSIARSAGVSEGTVRRRLRRLIDEQHIFVAAIPNPQIVGSAFEALVPAGTKTVMSTAAWHDYDVPGSPYFVLVDGTSSRVVGAGTASSWAQIHDLLNQALSDSPVGSGSRRGRSRLPGRRRAARADNALLAAGITPGHRSLEASGGER